MGISAELTLSIIMSISQFCNTYKDLQYQKRECIKQLWQCTRETKDAGVMPSRLFNCISDYTKDK